MPSKGQARRGSVPTHWLSALSLPGHFISRPQVTARLDELIASHRVTLMVAAAGFGKTAALSEWAAKTQRPFAWLSLTAADRHPARLRRGLAAALNQIDLDPDADPANWPVLVIDDIHLIDPNSADDLLGLEHNRLPVRLVLAGRYEPALGFARIHATGELGRLDTDRLALTEEEIVLAAGALGKDLSAEQAARLHRRTHGWPVAVRLAMMTSASDGLEDPALDQESTQIVDYLVESVLGQLPEPLAGFVQTACICDWLTAELAAELSGHSDGAALLEQAVGIGLPISRQQVLDREPVYRWHPVMAQAGRALLMRHNPSRARELHRHAARLLSAVDPYEAATHALQGNDPALAAELLRNDWLAGVLRGDSALVEELCSRLPAPHSDDPEILVIRAVCVRNGGDAAAAAGLVGRALVGRLGLPQDRQTHFRLTWMLAQLFLADGEQALALACSEAEEFLNASDSADGALRASVMFLIGWSLLRIRSVQTPRVLGEAVLRCRAEGLDDLAGRARASHAFSLAWAGDFSAAQDVLAAANPAHGSGAWRRTDGAMEAFSLAWMAFYRGDAPTALPLFRQVVTHGGAVTSAAGLAAIWMAHLAADLSSAALVAEAEQRLSEVPAETIQGLPWVPYSAVARARIASFLGDREEAVHLALMSIDSNLYIPATQALAAEILLECGQAEAAREIAAGLAEASQPYVAVAARLVLALCARAEGADPHDLVEGALAIAVEPGLARSFQRRDPQLAQMLNEHAARGTAYEQFLASVLSVHAEREPDGILASPLSQREREILGHLATTMTSVEICEALFISPNTLKTHVRSIYRKLGVSNRREASRLLRGQ